MGNGKRKKELQKRLEGRTTSEVREIINERIFSERDRHILIRNIIDDLTIEKIAEELKLSDTTIKTHVQRGRNVLIKYL